MWPLELKMTFQCDICGRKFISRESLNQHTTAKHNNFVEKKKKPNLKKYAIFGLIGMIIAFSIATSISYSQKPGKFDDFASCLSDKGAIVYGNDFCSYTAKQLNYFGKSKRNLDYVKCIDEQELCDSKGIKITPTWEYDGKMYEGVQKFERLSLITGCEI